MGDTLGSDVNSGLRLQQSFGTASGHGASASAAASTAQRPPSEERQLHTSNSGATYELGSGDLNQLLEDFWQSSRTAIESIDPEVEDFRTSPLPLARIKKIMKLDEDVRMVAHDAPLVFAKACELFTEELTLRGWDYTDKNKRRTLQRSDVATATEQNDIFDFLIDIVPRESTEAPRDDIGHQEFRSMVPNGQHQQAVVNSAGQSMPSDSSHQQSIALEGGGDDSGGANGNIPLSTQL